MALSGTKPGQVRGIVIPRHGRAPGWKVACIYFIGMCSALPTCDRKAATILTRSILYSCLLRDTLSGVAAGLVTKEESKPTPPVHREVAAHTPSHLHPLRTGKRTHTHSVLTSDCLRREELNLRHRARRGIAVHSLLRAPCAPRLRSNHSKLK